MATRQRQSARAKITILLDLTPPQQIRGLAVPRIVRTPDGCLTCRRRGYKCNWGLPACVTCDENGYECIQPISTTGYDDYVRRGDAQQPAAKPNTPKRRKSKSKSKYRKRRKHNYKKNIGIKLEPKGEGTMAQIKPKSHFDDGIISRNPTFQNRNSLFPVPRRTATHRCTRQPAPSHASGPQPGAEPGADNGSASASGPVAGPEAESSSASTSALAATTASGSASSGSAFQSVFVTRIKRHLYESQQRKLEHTPRHVKRSDSTSSDVDKDHDYATYYDYEYDSDPEVIHEEDPELSQMRTYSYMSNLFVVMNSWQGPGEPPLSIRIDDYISYMRENHLELGYEVTPLTLLLLPSCDYTASDTLFYYEKRPANYGVADLPDINPVNPKLVRLGYANPLVLQLIIAQRSNHREVSSAILPTGESAEHFLRDAIASFGPKIDRYLAGGEHEMPSLFMASIVVSLVERARLDKLSQAYDHPTAAKAILTNLHRLSSEEIFLSMPDFLIEYYMHTVSLACVAANPVTATGVPFISAPQLAIVDRLVVEDYVGNLCGTWLDIMATIPHIFRLGAIMYRRKLGTSTFEDASSEFLDFADIEDRLQASAQIEAGCKRTHTWQKVALLFKIAATLYLWSLLDEPLLHNPDVVPIDEDAELQYEDYEYDDPDERRQKLHKVFMKEIIQQADELLPTITLDSDFNLALCWPMLILGCFTKNKGTEEFIEQRLIDIAHQSTVGNCLETLFILRHVWTLPMSERSPWRIWHSPFLRLGSLGRPLGRKV
ncbi:hypothetical protein MKX08_003798 [Trichoderma sp. CBMAI-0020]|nr:hypothetical protein MKX08_003798 [Trichoderma sp. CBMAI-0020]